MQKAEIKQLLRDLKVAALLGQPEAIDIALNGLLSFPGVASNDIMNAGFIEKVILPVGKSLTTLKSAELRPLLGHQLAAGRAIGAVALAYLFVDGKNATSKDLSKPANDPRSDVRLALGKTLFAVAEADPEKILTLGTNWLMGNSPKNRYTALIFIPALAPRYQKRIVGLLGPIAHDEDRDVRAALADALILIAMQGLAEPVLELLSLWATESSPNSWVICRALSASWVIEHPNEVESILRELKSKTGESSQISGALKAIQRNGLEFDLS